MSAVIYILIGMVDVFAVFALSLKLYRLPLKQYIFPILGFCLASSAISYFVRVVIGLPWLDLAILALFLIAFFRLAMKLKLFYAALVTGAGLNAYILVQLAVLIAFMAVDGSKQTFIFHSQGVEVQLFQITSIGITLVIATFMKLFRYGFSFIPIPPHEFLIKNDYSKHLGLNIAVATTLIVVALSLVLLLNVNELLVFPSAIISFGLSYYFSNRRDLTID